MATAADSCFTSLFPFYVRLGSPVLQVVALSARLDEISLPSAAQSEPFLGLVGPPGRPRGPLPPSICAKNAQSKCVGRRRRRRKCAVFRWFLELLKAEKARGGASPGVFFGFPSPRPPKNLRLRRKIEGSSSPRRTALRIPQKVPCPNFVRLGLG